jgi:DNA-binding response OmpR family regulator
LSKILIADDEALIRLLIQETLEEYEDQGVEILQVDNGDAALQVAQDELPDLVFLDVMMPGINGFEVCQAIKNNPRSKHACVVLLTAKGQDADHERGLLAGADVYITKPFDPDELLGLAGKVLAP